MSNQTIGQTEEANRMTNQTTGQTEEAREAVEIDELKLPQSGNKHTKTHK